MAAKIANSRSVLLRAARDTSDETAKNALQQTAKKMAFDVQFARSAKTLDSLRGTEGESAAGYFQVFQQMISIPGPGV